MSTSEAELPIRSFLPEITRRAAADRALVLAAEPGAGKTSLVPQALADALGGKVLVMEPRRVAAVSAAARIAELWNKKLGDAVGYRVRGESRTSPRALVEAVTPGVLLRMIQDDPGLESCACVVLDEFHERSAQADLAFALLRQSRALRPELGLVAMSATMDTAKAAAALGALVLEVPGRAFPVETRYAPLQRGRGFEEAVSRLALDTMGETEGDVLVFLPGAAELRRAAAEFSRLADARQGEARPEAAILHGSLPLEEQRRILSPEPDAPRRAIFSTSIAETSLTLPRVTAVVDSGLARLQRFQARTGLNRLVTELESRDRAEQRRGRAGRLGPGLCVRAWAEAESLSERTEPELGRAELSGIVLEAALWGAPRRLDLDWLDPPPEGAWAAGTELLEELGAIGSDLAPTAIGRKMARLGTEPRLAALVLRGIGGGAGWEACLAAAALSERAASGSNELAERVAALASGRGRGEDAGTMAEARRLALAAGIAAHGAGAGEMAGGRAPAGLGALLAAAYPDRIGERVELVAGRARYRIPAGRMLSASGELALSPWILALEADSGEAQGRIYSGCALGEAEAFAALEAQADDVEEAEWKGLGLRLSRVHRAGAIVLSRRPAGAASAEKLGGFLSRRIGSEGLGFLPWDEGQRGESAREALTRLRYFADHRPEACLRRGLDPAILGDEALVARASEWLCPFVRTKGGPLVDGATLAAAVAALSPRALGAELEADAPRRLELPSGSSKSIEYGPSGAYVEARVQEFFGLAAQPRACGEPIVLRLLDPGGKPLQVTSDLPGFWRGSWAQARKDLRGRYPKHEWPEDPASASPSRSGIKKRPRA